MKPSCWLPTVRLTQRDIARPAVSGPSWPASSVRSMRSKSTRKVARLMSTHWRRSTTAGVSSAAGSVRADLGSHDRLDAQQGGSVEGLGLGSLGRRDRGGRLSQAPTGDLAHRVPVDQPRAGAAHDLARRHAGAQREQAADEDPRAELSGMS